jgi:hypothetical protein
MKNLYLVYISLFCWAFSHDVYARLEGTAKRLADGSSKLGEGIILLFVIITGIMYAMGSHEAKEKLKNVVMGAVLIFGGSTVFSWLKSTIR